MELISYKNSPEFRYLYDAYVCEIDAKLAGINVPPPKDESDTIPLIYGT